MWKKPGAASVPKASSPKPGKAPANKMPHASGGGKPKPIPFPNNKKKELEY